MSRATSRDRLTHGWEHGFPPGPRLVLGVLTGGYRGLLWARECLYARGVLASRAVGCPVVSVGNLTVGGTGKTPAVELAVQTLSDLGHRPAVVSRGYRRRSRGIQIVADTASIRVDPEDAGDEPFLLARRLPGVPVVVASDRYAAARLARERFGVTAIVLDDGFQHRPLTKDLEIVMTRARQPWGNGRLLPAGPLREPLVALARANLIVVTGAAHPTDLEEVRRTATVHAPGAAVLGARYAPVECWEADRMRSQPLGALRGARLVAFAGIGTPGAFASTLADLGVAVVAMVTFPDHHWYGPEELDRLEQQALDMRADGLVTTEKDWVRLRRVRLPRRPLYIISVRLELTMGEDVWGRTFEKRCPRA